jgi:membrane protein DedA with SNARE-associated domain
MSGWVTGAIAGAGYAGVFFMMILESMIFPLPSELVLPFTGFLVYTGQFGMLEAAVAATLGSIVGSLILYWIGMKFGRAFVVRYGRYFLLNVKHLDLAHNFFERYGTKTIFVSRLVPVVRHFISLPAGAARMNIRKFVFYTAAGAFIWNFFLIYVGYVLREQWSIILGYTETLDIIIIAAIVVFVIYLIINRDKK